MQKITIIGAGLVGSMQALFLSKRGYEVHVYEKRSDPRSSAYLGGKSINLALSDRGFKALNHVGLEDKIREITIPMYGRVMHNEQSELNFQPYGIDDQAIHSVPRADLNIMLLEEADKNPDVHLHFNLKLSHLNFGKKELTFEEYSTHKTIKTSYDVLFGTDGAFSAVRFALQKMPGINFTQQYISHGYKELTIPPGPDHTFLLENHNALHIWPRGNYMLIALPNHDKTFTCTLFSPFTGKDSFNELNTPEKFERFFKETFPDAYELIPNVKDEYERNPTSHLVYTLTNPWNYKNEVCIMGDAAHAVVPFYGQGMNSGFEDCTIFNETLDKHKGDIGQAIEDFASHRVKDAEAIKDLALYNFIEMRDKVADSDFLRQKKVEKFLHEKHPNLWVPLYSLVTFSHTPYSEAKVRGEKQRAIMQKVMRIPNIDHIELQQEVQERALSMIKAELN